MRLLILRSLLPVVFCCLLAANATAATLEGETLPDNCTVDGQTLVLNGIGLRTLTIFHIEAYVAALYLPQPSHDAQSILASSEPKIIVLKFMRGASKQRVERQYREGEANNCGDNE